MHAAHKRKRTKYSELAAGCREAVWTTIIYPVEVGSQAVISTLLWDVGVTRAKFCRATQVFAEDVVGEG